MVMSETLLLMSVCVRVDGTRFQNSDLFELTAVICFCIAATVVVAAEHEIDPPNYETMWEHHKTRLGTECDDAHEGSMLFGNSASNVQVICATNAQNLTHQLGLTRLPMSRERLPCAQVSSRELVEWADLLGTHGMMESLWPTTVSWVTQGASREVSETMWSLLDFPDYRFA